jgi:hypothetical protein
MSFSSNTSSSSSPSSYFQPRRTIYSFNNFDTENIEIKEINEILGGIVYDDEPKMKELSLSDLIFGQDSDEDDEYDNIEIKPLPLDVEEQNEIDRVIQELVVISQYNQSDNESISSLGNDDDDEYTETNTDTWSSSSEEETVLSVSTIPNLELANVEEVNVEEVNVEEVNDNNDDNYIITISSLFEDPVVPNRDFSIPLVKPLFCLPIKLEPCPICFEEIEMVNIVTTTCGHTFHSYCMFKTLETTENCPLCRNQLIEEYKEEDEDDDEDDDEDEDDNEDDYEEQNDDDNEEEEEEEDTKINLEQLSIKMKSMNYSYDDLVKILAYEFDYSFNLKSIVNNDKYTEEYFEKFEDDITKIIDGVIELTEEENNQYKIQYPQEPETDVNTNTNTNTNTIPKKENKQVEFDYSSSSSYLLKSLENKIALKERNEVEKTMEYLISSIC